MGTRVIRLIAPGTVLTGAILLGLMQAALVIWAAVQQPWLGVDLRISDSGIVVGSSAQDGPGRSLPEGAQVLRIAPPGGLGTAPAPGLTLEPADRIEEPDMLGSAPAMRRFLDRQGDLHGALQGGAVRFDYTTPEGARSVTLEPASSRPVTDLPAAFWTQIGVGLAGLWLGAWVVALRLSDRAAWMLLLAGLGLALSSQSAALYSTREIALDPLVFEIASRSNSIGTLIFGVGMVTLFLIYPKPLARGLRLVAPAFILIGTILWIQFDNWPERTPLLQPVVAATMAALLAALGAQIWANRRDARARAMLGWFGLSVAVGAGGFVLTVILPVMLGRPPVLAQSTAFLLFLLIYVGLCLGVLRYRLFDLADWSFRFLFYAGGVALLLALDALLIFGLALDRAPALGVSIAIVALAYLPLRGWLATRFRREREMSAEDLFLRFAEIAQADEPGEQGRRLAGLLRDRFAPLAITPLAAPLTEPQLATDGEALIFPSVAGLSAMRLDWAQGGERLFSSRDLAMAGRMASLLQRAIDQHRAYREAVEAERRRISRDMHDNIGVLLLGALHSPGLERKDLLIRQTLTDLREIISNPAMESLDLLRLLADLRGEVAEHLEVAGVTLDWQDGNLPEAKLSPRVVHTLRAFLREGISNLMRHSGAAQATVRITGRRISNAGGAGDAQPGSGAAPALIEGAPALDLCLRDDGRGFDPDALRAGNGFINLRDRIEQCGGRLEVRTGPEGTSLIAELPLSSSEKEKAA
ncbi:sensor histidine kinase [Szabonella alba]|uniref:ATPase n=1 Tax=Szabonella alba TaxID=2804194 RepID=A0A8K0VCZ3_9RHOB|nr:ATPase [Szabonella alba]MBL4917923.1 ATPase [Szabonella alba]